MADDLDPAVVAFERVPPADRDALYGVGIDAGAEALGYSPLPETYVKTVRAAVDAVLAARQPAPVDAETTTEWGVQYGDSARSIAPHTQNDARALVEDEPSRRLVSRTVTPWREVPRG